MLSQLFKKEQTALDAEIARLLDCMNEEDATSEEYSTLTLRLEQLHELKTKERPERVGRDTLAVVIGNLLGIVLIVAYEQKHVITSKGIGQIIRPK